MTRTLLELVKTAMEQHGESQEDVVAITIGPNGWGYGPDTHSVEFDDLGEYEGDTGYGSPSLPGIYMWTADRVYVKREYDGAKGVTSVPRNPSVDEAPGGIGGG